MQGLKFDGDGLVTAVAQDHATGEIRMVGWMNAEAVEQTLTTGLATFYSRSRQKLWVKGETSNHRLHVQSVIADCDADTLLLLVDPEGPTCHTGRPNCFFRPMTIDGPAPLEVGGAGAPPNNETATPPNDDSGALPYLFELESVIRKRQASTAERSYTRSLLDGGAPLVARKITEEAGELAEALSSESNARVTSEAADLLYHLLVSLRVRDVSFREVILELVARSTQSGHAEKASRKPPAV
jgi:phosphoribosyl-ATP pyrophosphohydrolase/phosphoribosyl-AMP cyclohydrolase